MQVKWFKDIDLKDLNAVRHIFYNLCKVLHPDKGGNANDFKEMYSEYEIIMENMDKGVFEKGKSSQTREMDLADIFERLMKIKGLVIELVGSWIWLTGTTYAVKATLKEWGFQWSGSKKAWYYNGYGDSKYKPRATCKNMEELYNKWGREIIKDEDTIVGETEILA